LHTHSVILTHNKPMSRQNIAQRLFCELAAFVICSQSVILCRIISFIKYV